jgi:hypothetical protein
MTWTTNQQAEIIRTERGLTITGTRTSIYDVIDLLKARRKEIGLNLHLLNCLEIDSRSNS